MKCEFDETNKCWDETVMSNMQFCPGEKPLAERQKEKSGRPRAQCGCSEGYPETAQKWLTSFVGGAGAAMSLLAAHKYSSWLCSGGFGHDLVGRPGASPLLVGCCSRCRDVAFGY